VLVARSFFLTPLISCVFSIVPQDLDFRVPREKALLFLIEGGLLLHVWPSTEKLHPLYHLIEIHPLA
jgi:hypothetical protein